MALIGTGSALIWLVAPVGVFIGTIGDVSVINAVYVDKRGLTDASVGGGSNLPLGAISLSENLAMLALGRGCRGSRSRAEPSLRRRDSCLLRRFRAGRTFALRSHSGP